MIATLTRFLPFHLLVSFIRQPSWFVLLLLLGYGLIYWLLGYLCFQTCLTYAKIRGVCSMYNEVKRFYLFRRRRWADTCLTPSTTSFSFLGFYSLLRGNSDFQLSLFLLLFHLDPCGLLEAMKSWSTRFGRDNPLAFSMLCNQCIEFICNEQWFTLFGCL